jgi:hypothetical protein
LVANPNKAIAYHNALIQGPGNAFPSSTYSLLAYREWTKLHREACLVSGNSTGQQGTGSFAGNYLSKFFHISEHAIEDQRSAIF